MAVQRRRASQDMVKEQGKLVVQVMKERTSAMEWEMKWGFLKNKRAFLEEEAAKRGMSKEEYWETVQKVTEKPISKSEVKTNISTGYFPRKSSEFIGWRHKTSLEKKEKPTIPPLQKLPSQNVIFLG